ncbi:MAG TPA: PBP1A family penicillin-binding protein, partial [Vicinamibacterales bacterium]|nr:PBP1A family penicillin-binding protein [Vicinamibacterales bacterium]
HRVERNGDAVSPHMINAILAVEDRRFFSHHGLDPIRMMVAAWRNVRAGRILEGGSTITQQLARVTQLSPERTYGRKIREVFIAARLEERYSKREILQEYLNAVYFGEGFHGVEAAARGYFGKSASELEPAEAALLAALVRSPANDAPCVAPERARRRRNLVLRLMRDQGHIGAEEFRAAVATGLPDPSHGSSLSASAFAKAATGLYFQEEVRRQLFAMFGGDRVLRGGLRVYSTYDPKLQRAAEQAIATRVAQIAKMRRAARDLQGSLVAIEPESGDVLALVGGRAFRESSFNRATQARRQAGSAFKPIIYAAALERGFAPGSLLRDLDAPIQAVDGPWLPNGEHERGEYTLRRALKVSSNRAAAQLLQRVGVTTAVYYAQRLGIESSLPLVPSLALGTGEVTLLELTAAYGAFANRGAVAHPRLITRVEDAEGTVLWAAPIRRTQAITPTTAYLMSSMLSDVVSSGTAATARAAGFKLPAAGKTGTTDDYADAWFVGYTPHLVAGVWFGLDRPAPIMTRGFAGTVAVPAWAKFMRAATAGSKPEWYAMPSDVQKVAVCPISGGRATEVCRHALSVRAVDAISDADYGVQTAAYRPADYPAEPDAQVYEDLFPIGAIPAETCWVHAADNAPPLYTPAATSTPMVDRALSGAGRSPTISDVPRTRLVVDRHVGADGRVRMVIREQ